MVISNLKFSILGGGRYFEVNFVISNQKFSMGGGWAFWSEIPERSFLENLDKNLLSEVNCTETCLCITDSLSHTTYVETNKQTKTLLSKCEFSGALVSRLVILSLCISNWSMSNIEKLCYRLPTNLQEGNIFTRICLSVQKRTPHVTITHDVLDLSVQSLPA